MRVHFFLPDEPDLGRLAELDPDRAPAKFRRGERAWILQTFLRLRQIGFDCELTGSVPAEGLVLFHSKHERWIRRGLPRGGAPVLVGVRADNRQALAAEFEIVQNGRWADGRVRHWLPNWPQPGLVARDARRATSVRTVAFKGFLANLHPDFLGERWRGFLTERGIDWLVDARPYEGVASDRAALDWSNYSAVDAIVAVRRVDSKTDFSKPATKLVNAWLAGVPALLGPEYAYQEIRGDELDYFEVDSVAAAERAIERLCSDPELFQRMVAHGRARATEFDVPALSARWAVLLGTTLPALAESSARRLPRRLPITVRRLARLLSRWAALRPAR